MLQVNDRTIIETAASLLSENGENEEYDRAIVELSADLLGLGGEDTRPLVEWTLRRTQVSTVYLQVDADFLERYRDV